VDEFSAASVPAAPLRCSHPAVFVRRCFLLIGLMASDIAMVTCNPSVLAIVSIFYLPFDTLGGVFIVLRVFIEMGSVQQ
jgi:hypothetical protein